MVELRTFIESQSVNTAISWLLVGLLALRAGASFLFGDILWGVYAVAIIAVALVPPLLLRDGSVLVNWVVLALAAAPVLAQGIVIAAEWTAYISLAALALLIVVEVHAFSSVEMPSWFAVLFVVLTTMTVAGLWGVLQYFSDVALGTSFLTGRTELMWDLVAATIVGIGAGVVFEAFFRKYDTVAASVDGVTD